MVGPSERFLVRIVQMAIASVASVRGISGLSRVRSAGSVPSKTPRPSRPRACSSGRPAAPVPRDDRLAPMLAQLDGALKKHRQVTSALLPDCRIDVPAEGSGELESWKAAVMAAVFNDRLMRVTQGLEPPGRLYATMRGWERQGLMPWRSVHGMTVRDVYKMRKEGRVARGGRTIAEATQGGDASLLPLTRGGARADPALLEIAWTYLEVLLALPHSVLLAILPDCCISSRSNPLFVNAVHPELADVDARSVLPRTRDAAPRGSGGRRPSEIAALLESDPDVFRRNMLFGVELELAQSFVDLCRGSSGDLAEFADTANKCTAEALGVGVDKLAPPLRLTPHDSHETGTWMLTRDSSVSGTHRRGAGRYGCTEVVSPVLRAFGPQGGGTTLDSEHIIYAMLDHGISHGGTAGLAVNETTGMHVHVSCRDHAVGNAVFRSDAFAFAMRHTWTRLQGALCALVEQSRGDNMYCMRMPNAPPLADAVLHAVAAEPWDQLVASPLRRNMVPHSRYHSLNMAALLKHGTMEVRLHHGTVDAPRVYMWAMLMCSLFASVMHQLVAAWDAGPAALETHLANLQDGSRRPPDAERAMDELMRHAKLPTIQKYWREVASRPRAPSNAETAPSSSERSPSSSEWSPSSSEWSPSKRSSSKRSSEWSPSKRSSSKRSSSQSASSQRSSAQSASSQRSSAQRASSQRSSAQNASSQRSSAQRSSSQQPSSSNLPKTPPSASKLPKRPPSSSKVPKTKPVSGTKSA
jgi:hypothetical protein